MFTVFLIYICIQIAGQSISIVHEHNLYPLWDPATHAFYGWKIYFTIIQLNPLNFLWEIWSKGLWPFMYYLFQAPFYFFTSYRFEASLFSSLFAFLCLGVLSCIFFNKTIKTSPIIAVGVFLLLLISSPVYIAFSTLSMTEIFGSLMQLLLFTTYILVTVSKSRKYAILFSVSLTLLFFTKYNYFILAVVPLIINEYILYTKNWTLKDHIDFLFKSLKRIFSSLTGIVLVCYFIFLSVLISTGGFEFHIFNQRVSVHSIGNTGYTVLYFLLIRFWLLRRKKKIDINGFLNKDFRIKPLINYFIIPLIVWFAIPYPNHIQEFFGLIVNRQSEGATLSSSFSFYFNILKNDYFQSSIVFYFTSLVFIIALLRFRIQAQMTKWLIIATLIQLFLVISHPYKDARFIFTALLPLWLVASIEINSWITKIKLNKIMIYLITLITITIGLFLFQNALHGESFKKFAFSYYTESPELMNGFNKIRNQINNDDKLVVIGSVNNILSPALIEWEFGEPRGYKNFRGIITGSEYKKLNGATHILIIAPLQNNNDTETLDSFNRHSKKIEELFAEDKFQLLYEIDINDFRLSFRIYGTKKL